MKKALALVVGLGMAAAVGHVSLVRAECGGKHATQTSLQTSEKDVTQTPAPVSAATVRTAQAEKMLKSAPEVKK